MVTLKDIAKLANVSVMTVSRVVNGNYSKVSAETAEKIQKIIDECGYVPNYSARSLISKKTNIIAIILRKESRPDDPYNAKMLAGIIPYLQENDYYSMVVGLDNFDEVRRHLRSWHAAGAIFLGLFEEDVIKIKDEHQIPLVFTDSYHDLPDISNVGIDDYHGGEIAAEHFIENGHKELAMATYAIDESPICNARFRGYKDALAKHGLNLDDDNIYNNHSAEHVVDKLTKSKATGIFITADILALDIINELQSRGYHVPNDYSVIGFDNLPHGNYASPKLTTISQNIEEKAKVACEILLNNIDNKLPAKKYKLDVSLEKRESVKSLL